MKHFSDVGVDASAEAAYDILFHSGSISGEGDVEKKNREDFESSSSKTNSWYIGGSPPPTIGDVSAWQRSVLENPFPTNMTLTNISMFLNVANFPGFRDIYDKWAPLDQALWCYKQSQDMTGCKPPSSDKQPKEEAPLFPCIQDQAPCNINGSPGCCNNEYCYNPNMMANCTFKDQEECYCRVNPTFCCAKEVMGMCKGCIFQGQSPIYLDDTTAAADMCETHGEYCVTTTDDCIKACHAPGICPPDKRAQASRVAPQ